jgi:hypothetical protein
MAKKHRISQSKRALDRCLYGSQGAAGPAVSLVTGEVLKAMQGPPRPKDWRQPALNGDRSYLVVPFDQRDQVKALGGRWDPRLRRWWISATADRAPFAAWKPYPWPLAAALVRGLAQPSGRTGLILLGISRDDAALDRLIRTIGRQRSSPGCGIGRRMLSAR